MYTIKTKLLMKFIRTIATNPDHVFRKYWRDNIEKIPGSSAIKKILVYLHYSIFNINLIPIKNIDSIEFSKNFIHESTRENVFPKKFWGPSRFKPEILTFSYESPACIAYKISNAIVIGNSDSIIHNNQLLSSSNYDLNQHINTLEQSKFITINHTINSVKMLTSPNSSIKYGVSIVGDGAGNFAHFMTEIIPRLVLIDKQNEYLDYPLIVDGWIGKNLTKIIHFFNINCREIISIDRWQRLLVEDLVYISPPTYSPQDFRANFSKTTNDNSIKFSYKFNSKALNLVRDFAHKKIISLGLNPSKKKKIYLERKPIFKEGVQYNLRHIVNDDEVKSILVRRGYHIIDITEMDFIEQLKLFSGVDIIISPLGAAMANVLFSNASTKVLGLSAYYDNADYSYWVNFMSATGNPFEVVLGSQIKSFNDHPMHRPYSICTQSLISALDSLEIH